MGGIDGAARPGCASIEHTGTKLVSVGSVVSIGLSVLPDPLVVDQAGLAD